MWQMNHRNGYFRHPNSHFPPSRGQKWAFCPFLPSRTAFFGAFEDKSADFVLFWSTFSRFWGFSRTKTCFLSSGGLPNSIFGTSRAQNSTFCALWTFRTALFRSFERKSWVFARFGYANIIGYLCVLNCGVILFNEMARLQY